MAPSSSSSGIALPITGKAFRFAFSDREKSSIALKRIGNTLLKFCLISFQVVPDAVSIKKLFHIRQVYSVLNILPVNWHKSVVAHPIFIYQKKYELYSEIFGH
jgi:hypothetical protein